MGGKDLLFPMATVEIAHHIVCGGVYLWSLTGALGRGGHNSLYIGTVALEIGSAGAGLPNVLTSYGNIYKASIVIMTRSNIGGMLASIHWAVMGGVGATFTTRCIIMFIITGLVVCRQLVTSQRATSHAKELQAKQVQ